MDASELLNNDYFQKIVLSLIPILFKSFFGSKDDANALQKLTTFVFNFGLPATIILWINLDEKVESNKLTFSLIAFNFTLIIFNYFQQKLISHYKLITRFTTAETDKIQQINNINNTQIEKVNAINENQKYILSELSKINDRIILYFGRK